MLARFVISNAVRSCIFSYIERKISRLRLEMTLTHSLAQREILLRYLLGMTTLNERQFISEANHEGFDGKSSAMYFSALNGEIDLRAAGVTLDEIEFRADGFLEQFGEVVS